MHNSLKEPTAVVDLKKTATHQPPALSRIAWIVCDSYRLTQADKSVLLNSTEWLNDSLINASQILLQQQSPVGGLQNTNLGLTFAFEIQSQEFIQTLHNGWGHWLMVSNIGAKDCTEVFVCDSMYPTVNTYVKRQIAALLACWKSTINLKMIWMFKFKQEDQTVGFSL